VSESSIPYAAGALGRMIGTILVFIGAGIIVVSPAIWDSIFLTLPSGIEIHVYDLIGVAVITPGIVLFWR
jgi:hypothetical protein